MENKNKIIVMTAAVALIVIVIAVLLAVINKNNSEKVSGLNAEQENLVSEEVIVEDSTVPEYFDIEKINEAQIIKSEDTNVFQASILESPDFSIPKDVTGVEMMTKSEKLSMGLDENLDIQILGRNEAGQITGYQFISSEEDFVRDLR